MNKTNFERLYNGLVKENPTFVLMLGMCPTLAVTTSAINGMGMGLTTAVVLALSNVIISLLRKVIPSKVRIPAFIVIIASFVTVVQLLLEAYLPSLNEALGVYIPLIVVNCIILGRAEAYAYSNPPIPSLFDGIGMGLGFTVALTLIGAVREVLGAGQIFGITIPGMVPIGIFVLAPGAFFVLAVLTAVQNFIKIQGEKRGKDMSKIQSGCNEDCMNCADAGCGKRFYDANATDALETEATQDEVELIDLDEEDTETTEVEVVAEAAEVPAVEKPKRKPRKKKAEVVEEVAEEQAATETATEEVASEVVTQEPAAEAEVIETPAESKPKRKPRKKKTEVVEEVVEEQSTTEPATEETPSVEVTKESVAEAEVTEVPAEAKPKRKPRKKKTEEPVAETPETETPSETSNDNQEKEDN